MQATTSIFNIFFGKVSLFFDKIGFLFGVCKHLRLQSVDNLNLSGKVVHRTIKLARTTADMKNKSDISLQKLAAATQYRSRTMFVDNE